MAQGGLVDDSTVPVHLRTMVQKLRGRGGAARGAAPRLTVTEADLRWRHEGMGRLLNVAVRRMQARVIAKMIQVGHKDMRLALVNLTRNLDLDGTTLTELANRAVMTKQAMGELADLCERLGIVERTTKLSDRRVRLIKFTDKGLIWLTELGGAVAEAEAEMRGVIGDPAYRALSDWLKAYNTAPLPELGPEWTGVAEGD